MPWRNNIGRIHDTSKGKTDRRKKKELVFYIIIPLALKPPIWTWRMLTLALRRKPFGCLPKCVYKRREEEEIPVGAFFNRCVCVWGGGAGRGECLPCRATLYRNRLARVGISFFQILLISFFFNWNFADRMRRLALAVLAALILSSVRSQENELFQCPNGKSFSLFRRSRKKTCCYNRRAAAAPGAKCETVVVSLGTNNGSSSSRDDFETTTSRPSCLIFASSSSCPGWRLQGLFCYKFFDVEHSWERAADLCKRWVQNFLFFLLLQGRPVVSVKGVHLVLYPKKREQCHPVLLPYTDPLLLSLNGAWKANVLSVKRIIGGSTAGVSSDHLPTHWSQTSGTFTWFWPKKRREKLSLVWTIACRLTRRIIFLAVTAATWSSWRVTSRTTFQRGWPRRGSTPWLIRTPPSGSVWCR